MNARILPLDSDEHRTVQTLLPWYANATLEDSENARVDAHLALCPRCQADVEFQRRLCGTAPAARAEVPNEVERGWLALRARIDAKPAGAPRPVPRASWLASRWLPLALGLQTALVLVLATALFAPARQGEYRTLGAAPGAPAANALVVFRADASEADIRRALRTGDARLVGGPTVTDAYLLRIPDLDARSLAKLRAEPAVARVESLEAEPAR